MAPTSIVEPWLKILRRASIGPVGILASIVVVDDENAIRTLLHRRLTSQGHEVATFATPDVLMDVAQEGTDGHDACRRSPRPSSWPG